jgi:hypothetical protein
MGFLIPLGWRIPWYPKTRSFPMKTVFCVAAESSGSGAVDWWSTPAPAETQLREMSADQNFAAETLTRFDLQVPEHADTGAITDLVDDAMWNVGYTPLSRRVGADGVLANASPNVAAVDRTVSQELSSSL